MIPLSIHVKKSKSPIITLGNYFGLYLRLDSSAICLVFSWRVTYNGGALYVSGSGGSLLVNESIFINNTADKRDGGALYLAGKFSNATITKSTFIYNSANHSNCGVIYSTTHVHLMDSIFYYNRANGDGGAACIRNATLQMHICSKSCCWKWWVIPFRQQRCRHQFYFVLK